MACLQSAPPNPNPNPNPKRSEIMTEGTPERFAGTPERFAIGSHACSLQASSLCDTFKRAGVGSNASLNAKCYRLTSVVPVIMCSM
jgi:hypothetical protein